MPENNGDYASRFERLEKLAAAHSEQIGGLIEHAAMTDQRIELLRQSQLDANANVKSLVAAIRELVDRIPPENLR